MMTDSVLLALAGAAGPVQEIAETFGVDWPHLIAQIISFSIVCFVLYKLAYRPILAMLDRRREQIAQGIANAEKIRAQLDSIEVQRREIMVEANAQATKHIEEARAAAVRLAEEESQKAIERAEEILNRAREAAALERDRMLADLKREVGRMVVQATTAVTGKILTAEDHRRLAEETAKQVASR